MHVLLSYEFLSAHDTTLVFSLSLFNKGYKWIWEIVRSNFTAVDFYFASTFLSVFSHATDTRVNRITSLGKVADKHKQQSSNKSFYEDMFELRSSSFALHPAFFFGGGGGGGEAGGKRTLQTWVAILQYSESWQLVHQAEELTFGLLYY